jgi:hypothetical protein
MKKIILLFCLFLVHLTQAQLPLIKISPDQRHFITSNGKPFFWLGDTGWLLFSKCTREEVITYLDARKAQGFNLIQVMVLHELKQAKNVYGDSALIHLDIAKPDTLHHYWDHIIFVIDEAAKRGIYIGLVPIWGSNVKGGLVSEKQAKIYAQFLANRFKYKTNIVWLNGGDIKGSDGEAIWNIIGTTIKQYDPNHLITFHPRGRSTSSTWFHSQHWLDFNMFQSGHKDYAQDTTEPRIGEDNWKFAQNDYALQPTKPTLDGEPSYEHIPHGLHDSLALRWTANDVRRYAYWSVFSGTAGFTYGENSVMQFKRVWNKDISFGPVLNWQEALLSEGANQMKYLKAFISSTDFLHTYPMNDIVVNQGVKYQYMPVLAEHGNAYIYNYTGRVMHINLLKINTHSLVCQWYNPQSGQMILIGRITPNNNYTFTPPGKEVEGNDWVLSIRTKE